MFAQCFLRPGDGFKAKAPFVLLKHLSVTVFATPTSFPSITLPNARLKTFSACLQESFFTPSSFSASGLSKNSLASLCTWTIVLDFSPTIFCTSADMFILWKKRLRLILKKTESTESNMKTNILLCGTSTMWFTGMEKMTTIAFSFLFFQKHYILYRWEFIVCAS